MGGVCKDSQRTRAKEVEKSQGLGPSGPIVEVAAVHVNLRVETGFDLVLIIAEYRALRSSALRLWAKDDPEGFTNGAAEIIRFNEAIDQNVAKTVQYYQEREIQYRDRFLGILGHDLRNPVHAILAGSVFLVARHSQPRREEALAHYPDLVLDLPLLPTRGRRAGGWLDPSPLLGGVEVCGQRLATLRRKPKGGAVMGVAAMASSSSASACRSW
jgi:signal transduction histidine kinase